MRGLVWIACSLVVAPACNLQAQTTASSQVLPSSPPPPENLGVVPPSTGEAPPQWQPFADAGISLTLTYTGQAAANPIGGLRQSAAYAGQLYVAADVKTEPLLGIRGGTVHFAVSRRDGQGLSQNVIGNNTSVQEIYGLLGTRLAFLSYEQTLFNDAISVHLGKANVNDFYLASPLYCNFQSNAVCGTPAFPFRVSNMTTFPAATFMANARVQLSGRMSVQAGAFEANPTRLEAGQNNFNLNFKHATGVYVPFELTHEADASETRLPHHYTLGGWFDRSRYRDPVRDEDGGFLALTGRPGKRRFGRTGIYGRFDQMLTRPDPRSVRGLTLFGAALFNLQGGGTEANAFELGVLQKGTLSGRDRDTLGLVVSRTRFSDAFLRSMRAVRESVGRTDAHQRYTAMIEVNYGAQVSPWLRLSPSFQYLAKPDQSRVPRRLRDTPNAWVLGLEVAIDFLSLPGRSRPSGPSRP